MKNSKSLRNQLSYVFDLVLAQKLDPREAAQLASIAGKMIAVCKLEMAYNKQTGKPEQIIDFLEQ